VCRVGPSPLWCVEVIGPARTFVPIVLVLASAVLAPAASASAPVRVEIALDRTADTASLIRAARGLHVGPVRQIAPLRVVIMRTRRPAELIARLRSQPGVSAVAPALRLRPTADTEVDIDPGTGIAYSWAFDAVNAGPAIAAVGGGSSFPVGIIDTGVDTSEPDLAGRIATLRHDAATGGDDVTDKVGHGTMVAGVIAMVAGNGIGGRGIAGATQIVPIRVSTTGLFFSDAVAQSIVWAVNHGLRVVNMSLGGTELVSPALSRALAYAADHDTLLVAAAGNNGEDGDALSYPAAQLGAPNGGWSKGLSVAATRPDGTAASFSSHNADISVAAPGAAEVVAAPGAVNCPGGVFSTLPSEGTHTFADDPANCDSLFGQPNDPVGGRYAYAEGTSFSAPIVSAVASLVLQANPALHEDQVADVIRRSAHQTVGAGWNQYTGAGVVDALAAVNLARTYDTVAPTISFAAVPSGSSVIASVDGVDQAGPGELLAGPGESSVGLSTDGKTFRKLFATVGTPLREAIPIGRGARIWIRGTTCDLLHNCTSRDAGPFEGGQAAPEVKLELSGPAGRVFRLHVHLGALANSYRASVRLEVWNGHRYRVFQTVRLPFGSTVSARERVPGAGRFRLRARVVPGPLWRSAASSLLVDVR
jgi:subtilisin family serine protease